MLDKLDELFPAQVGQPRQYKFRIIHAVPAFCFDTYPWQTYRIQAGTVAANQNEFPDVEQWVISIETNNIIPDNVVQNAIPLNIQHINLNQQIEIPAVQAVEEAGPRGGRGGRGRGGRGR